jgi:branched-chain amino acid transport system substrate-binding protein
MQFPKIRAFTATAIAAAALLAGCQKGGAPQEDTSGQAQHATGGATGDVIRVGEYGSMTGSEATFGQSTHNGIQMAVDEVNAAGGVKGKKIELITYDTEGKAQQAGTVVTRLITSDKVVAVLGEVASSLSLAGGRVCQQYGVPMISPSSTNPQVTQIGNMVFRVCFLDDFQGWAVAKFARENLGCSKVAILYDQSQAYSTGLRDYFQKAFTQMGGQVTTTPAYNKGDPDFSAQLTSIRGTNPCAVFLPGYYTDAGNISLQARKLGIDVPLLGGDGWDSAQLAAIGGQAIEGCYYSNHYSPSEPRPEVQSFVGTYRERFGQTPDALAPLGYDAAKLLFDAMERSPSLGGQDIAQAIAATKDFNGVTGHFSIDAARNAKKPAVIVQLKDGVPVYTSTVEPPQETVQ